MFNPFANRSCQAVLKTVVCTLIDATTVKNMGFTLDRWFKELYKQHETHTQHTLAFKIYIVRMYACIVYIPSFEGQIALTTIIFTIYIWSAVAAAAVYVVYWVSFSLDNSCSAICLALKCTTFGKTLKLHVEVCAWWFELDQCVCALSV